MSSTTRAPRRSAPLPVSGRSPKASRLTLAPISRRIGGAAIDMALLVTVSGVLAAWIDGAMGGVTRVRLDAAGARTVDSAVAMPLWFPLALLVVLTAVYTIVPMALWGRTLGGWALGIRCVRADTGGRLGWTLSARRWLALYGVAGMVGFLPIIGAFAWLITLVVGLSPLWDGTQRMRGYADHLAGDLVVDSRRR